MQLAYILLCLEFMSNTLFAQKAEAEERSSQAQTSSNISVTDKKNSELINTFRKINAYKIKIGTGPLNKIYYIVGKDICRIINHERKSLGIRCKTFTSSASQENLELLRDKKVEMALVQSDWQKHAIYGSNNVYYNLEQNPEIRSIIALYNEPILILVRRDSDITSLQDLRGKKLSTGAVDSSVKATFSAILKTKGWSYKDFQSVQTLTLEEQADALCDRKVDALVTIVAHPNDHIENITRSCQTKFIPIPVDDADFAKLVREQNEFNNTKLPAGTYPGSPYNINTVSVSTVLTTLASVSEDLVYKITKTIAEKLPNTKGHKALQNSNIEEMILMTNTAQLHPGALQYFKERAYIK